jgi:proteasome assembly chaperone (PAC2) family protein
VDAVRRLSRPQLRRPRAIVAFEGWSDACEAASGALAVLLDRYGVDVPFATIEPEEFMDFQEQRPTVEITDGGMRRLTWPETRFYGIRLPDSDRDLVLVVGQEPAYRWKTFARTVSGVLGDAGVELVVFLGAYIGSVTHQQPVPLSGVASTPDLITRFGLTSSDYEGPTGIVGVLGEACRETGLSSVGVWAATPHYLAANPNPAAMRALLRKAGEIIGFEADSGGLEKMERDFLERVDAAVAASDNLTEYLEELEGDGRMLDPQRSGELVNEIEDFLRDQG